MVWPSENVVAYARVDLVTLSTSPFARVARKINAPSKDDVCELLVELVLDAALSRFITVLDVTVVLGPTKTIAMMCQSQDIIMTVFECLPEVVKFCDEIPRLNMFVDKEDEDVAAATVTLLLVAVISAVPPVADGGTLV